MLILFIPLKQWYNNNSRTFGRSLLEGARKTCGVFLVTPPLLLFRVCFYSSHKPPPLSYFIQLTSFFLFSYCPFFSLMLSIFLTACQLPGQCRTAGYPTAPPQTCAELVEVSRRADLAPNLKCSHTRRCFAVPHRALHRHSLS